MSAIREIVVGNNRITSISPQLGRLPLSEVSFLSLQQNPLDWNSVQPQIQKGNKKSEKRNTNRDVPYFSLSFRARHYAISAGEEDSVGVAIVSRQSTLSKCGSSHSRTRGTEENAYGKTRRRFFFPLLFLSLLLFFFSSSSNGLMFWFSVFVSEGDGVSASCSEDAG